MDTEIISSYLRFVGASIHDHLGSIQMLRYRVQLGLREITDDEIRKLLETVEDQLEFIADDLRMLDVGSGGFPVQGFTDGASLQNALQMHASILGLNANISVSGNLGSKAERVHALYLIAREAMMNARKHSKSEQVSLELVADENSYTLTAVDFGIGFDKNKVWRRNGISFMEELAHSYQGDFEIQSAENEGTRIKVSLLKS